MEENLIEEKNISESNNELRRSKIFFAVFFLLIIGSIGATYYRTMIKKDYIISTQVDCDPTIEKCFIWECDPASIVEGEACTGDPESDIWYYKVFERKAYNVPLCDPNDETCEAMVCAEGEKDCGEKLCSPETVPEGESCNDPEQYNIDNPPEEESEECEEGDEECLSAEEECDSETEDCAAAESEETADEVTAEEATTDEVAEGEAETATPTINAAFPIK